MSDPILVNLISGLQDLIKSMIGVMETDVANITKLEKRVANLEGIIMNYIKEEEKERISQTKSRNIPEAYPKVRVR